MKVLSTNYGHARIDFGQPFSLREFVHNQKRASFSQLPLSSQAHNDILSGCTPPLSPSPLNELPAVTSDRNSEQIKSLPQPFPQPETALYSHSPLVMGKSHQRSLSTPAVNGHLRLKRTTSNPSNTLNSVTCTNSRLTGTPSSSSLFGTEVTEEYRSLVKSLSVHIVFGKYSTVQYSTLTLRPCNLFHKIGLSCKCEIICNTKTFPPSMTA